MESLREDRSYTGRLMLCEEQMQARDDHKTQTNIELAYHYSIGVSKRMVTPLTCTHQNNTNQHKNSTKRVGPITLERRGLLN